MYCIEYRQLPFPKQQCSFGHEYEYKDTFEEYAYVCDACGVAGSVLTPFGVLDPVCDVYICSLCFGGLFGEEVEREGEERGGAGEGGRINKDLGVRGEIRISGREGERKIGGEKAGMI